MAYEPPKIGSVNVDRNSIISVTDLIDTFKDKEGKELLDQVIKSSETIGKILNKNKDPESGGGIDWKTLDKQKVALLEKDQVKKLVKIGEKLNKELKNKPNLDETKLDLVNKSLKQLGTFLRTSGGGVYGSLSTEGEEEVKLQNETVNRRVLEFYKRAEKDMEEAGIGLADSKHPRNNKQILDYSFLFSDFFPTDLSDLRPEPRPTDFPNDEDFILKQLNDNKEKFMIRAYCKIYGESSHVYFIIDKVSDKNKNKLERSEIRLGEDGWSVYKGSLKGWSKIDSFGQIIQELGLIKSDKRY